LNKPYRRQSKLLLMRTIVCSLKQVYAVKISLITVLRIGGFSSSSISLVLTDLFRACQISEFSSKAFQINRISQINKLLYFIRFLKNKIITKF